MSSKLFVFGASNSINKLPRLIKDALFQEMQNDTIILVSDRTKTDYLLQRFVANGCPYDSIYGTIRKRTQVCANA